MSFDEQIFVNFASVVSQIQFFYRVEQDMAIYYLLSLVLLIYSKMPTKI